MIYTSHTFRKITNKEIYYDNKIYTKKYLLIIATIIVTAICSLTGCGGNNESEQEKNPLLNKVYNGNYTPDFEQYDLIKFYDDNTLQIIEIRGIGDFVSHYGTYKIDNSAITMSLADKSYSGVIIDDGESIKFGVNEYLDYTERFTNANAPILDEFDK